MASPPTLNLTIEDGGLGIAPVGVNGATFKFGVCSLGTPNIVYNIADPNVIKSTLGQGPLVESGVYQANKSGKPQYFVPVTPSVVGTVGSITHTGSGPTLTESGAPYDNYAVIITITKAGNQGIGTFTVSLDGGDSTSAQYVVPTSGAFLVPNTNMTFNFPAGTASAVVNVGGGPTITIAGTPTTLSNVQIKITTGGVLGTSQFTYAINGGTPSTPQVTPVGFTFLVPGTGITATFAAGTYLLNATYDWTITGVPYVAGDLYTCTATAPGYSTGDLGTALDAMNASTLGARFAHVIGFPSSAAVAASIVALVETSLETAQGKFKFMRAIVDGPKETVATDAQLIAAFVNVNAPRVGVGAGTAQLFSDVATGRDYRRSSGWVIMARAALISISQDLGWVGAPQGSIPGINVASTLSGANSNGIYRDETATPGLDAQRFMTLRTFPLYPGIFITKGRMMAAPGSDFGLLQYGVIMDVACEIAYAQFLPFLNAKIPTDPTTGYILDAAATAIEDKVNAVFDDQLVTTGDCASSSVQITRNNNILSSGIMYAKVRLQPQGYPTDIEVDIGFINPALLAAAA